MRKDGATGFEIVICEAIRTAFHLEYKSKTYCIYYRKSEGVWSFRSDRYNSPEEAMAAIIRKAGP